MLEHFSSSSSILQKRSYEEFFEEDEEEDQSVEPIVKVTTDGSQQSALDDDVPWTTKVVPFLCQMRSSRPFSRPFIGVSYIDTSICHNKTFADQVLEVVGKYQTYFNVCNCHRTGMP